MCHACCCHVSSTDQVGETAKRLGKASVDALRQAPPHVATPCDMKFAFIGAEKVHYWNFVENKPNVKNYHRDLGSLIASSIHNGPRLPVRKDHYPVPGGTEVTVFRRLDIQTFAVDALLGPLEHWVT